MKQKRTWFLLATLLFLFFAMPFLSLSTSKDEDPVIFSPALNVLANNTTLQKCARNGSKITFSSTEIDDAFGMDHITSITILTLPPQEDGKLLLGEIPVLKNQTIPRKDWEKLVFIPRNAAVSQTSFTFCNQGKEMIYNLSCVLFFTEKENFAPTFLEQDTHTLTIETISDIAVFGTMRGYDPDGDKCTFQISSYPKKGVLQITDEKIGSYCYIPRCNKSGKDTFSYQIVDCYGNRSDEITITVEIEKSNLGLVYEDLIGHKAHFAAIVLKEANILSGCEVNGLSFFDPNRTVSQGDFLMMAMQSADIPLQTCSQPLPFSNDESIPDPYRNYIHTALEMGLIEYHSENPVFDVTHILSRAEASVLVQRLVQPAVPSEAPVFADKESIPIWAEDAISALCHIGWMQTDDKGNICADTALTRADSAQLLYSLYNYIHNN